MTTTLPRLTPPLAGPALRVALGLRGVVVDAAVERSDGTTDLRIAVMPGQGYEPRVEQVAAGLRRLPEVVSLGWFVGACGRYRAVRVIVVGLTDRRSG